MDFQYTNLNPYECSIEDLEKEIKILENQKDNKFTEEQSIKVFQNSIYGACASPFFIGYNTDIAEAVTLQGQDIIKYTNIIIEDYFSKHWHRDKELHQKLKITYANQIKDNTVVYNDTDSIKFSSLIHIDKNIKKTIEDFYNDNIVNGSAGLTQYGHESVKSNDRVLNWSSEKGLYYVGIKRIIRHKVNKTRWLLKTKSGKEIEVTNDHSIIVFRNEKQLDIKACYIKPKDKIICVFSKKTEFYFDEVENCEEVGTFDDEYVYDIEVDDDTHTFIANDILVHNSCYVTFDPLLKSCDSPKENKDIIDFILKIKEYRLNNYLEEKFKEYAKERNTENIQDLELEKISYSALLLAKKKYVLDIAWKTPSVIYDPQTKITPTGVEIVQGSTPKFVRKVLKELINLILFKGKNIEYSEIVKKLKEYKSQFLLQEPDDISKTVSIGDYEKYVLNDKKEIKLADKCPINVRASAIYNNKILNTKWKSKYNLIKTGDKIKHYYAMGEHDVFGFLPNNYPYEFAPKINYDVQFAKVIIEPFNRFMEPLGFAPIPENLLYCKALF